MFAARRAETRLVKHTREKLGRSPARYSQCLKLPTRRHRRASAASWQHLPSPVTLWANTVPFRGTAPQCFSQCSLL
eukprot:scaffold13845_cov72-Phaeocystis_antarctica.AAC.2